MRFTLTVKTWKYRGHFKYTCINKMALFEFENHHAQRVMNQIYLQCLVVYTWLIYQGEFFKCIEVLIK